MGRDDLLLDRLYGGSNTAGGAPVRGRYGWAPALWIFGLLCLAAASGLVSIIALTLGLWPSPLERELVSWGVVDAGQSIWLYHDHSASGDGSAGCAAAGDQLVRWEERRPVDRVTITGADIDVELGSRVLVRVSRDGRSVTCPFQLGEGADSFSDALRLAAARRVRQPWGPGRTDPRL